MLWTYRVFRDNQGRYSIREVFYDRDRTIINYGKRPATATDASLEDLQQLVCWFQEAFELPILELEEVDKSLVDVDNPSTIAPENQQNLSLKQVIAELDKESES